MKKEKNIIKSVSSNIMALIKKMAIFLSFILLFTVISKTPYLNLLFPPWVICLLLWLLGKILFQFSGKFVFITSLALWIIAMLSLLLKNGALAETLAIVIYFLLFFYFLSGMIIFIKKNHTKQ